MMRPRDEKLRCKCVEYRNKWFPKVPIYDRLPDGWHVVAGTLTQPTGCVWIQRGPFLLRDASPVRKNPDYRSALMWDERYC